jgi:hypothetical protein
MTSLKNILLSNTVCQAAPIGRGPLAAKDEHKQNQAFYRTSIQLAR